MVRAGRPSGDRRLEDRAVARRRAGIARVAAGAVDPAAHVHPAADGDRAAASTAVYGTTAGRPRRRRSSASRASTSAFTQPSYAPGRAGRPTSRHGRAVAPPPGLRYQSPGRARASSDLKTNGLAMTARGRASTGAPTATGPRCCASCAPATGRAASTSCARAPTDGRVGYAPFIVRPRRLGTSRVAVVLVDEHVAGVQLRTTPTATAGATRWYVSARHRSVDLERPFLDFGVPFRFHDWDLDFIAWLNRTGKQVDFLSDDDLDAVASGDELRARVRPRRVPGPRGVRDAARVRRRRALPRPRRQPRCSSPANNFFWPRATATGRGSCGERLWRELGRPESALVGVQYVGSDHGPAAGPFVVAGAAALPWAVRRARASRTATSFGRYGIEIDARTPASPPRHPAARAHPGSARRRAAPRR